MKLCPKCGRKYPDETLSYCLDDGSELVYGPTTEAPTLTGGSLPLDPAQDTQLFNAPPDHRKPAHVPRRSFSKPILIVAAGAVVLTAIFFIVRFSSHTPATNPNEIHSLAILPFRPLSAESRDETLELGMADALITKLGSVKQVIVRPLSSVIKYENSDKDSLAAGREQGVDAVVEGKVQRAEDQLRLTVQLIRVSDGVTLWTGTFDDKFNNIFAVQDSVSSQVAAALVPQLTSDEQRRLAKHYTDNIEAYQLYLKGRTYWYKFTPADVEKSIDYFNRAIELDHNYALAYAGLSFAYSVQAAIGALPPTEVFPKSRQAAETALQLDDTLSEAHVAVGGKYLFYDRDWPNAQRELLRAIELNPNLSDAHQLLGYYWEVMGQLDKAGIELKEAQRLAPLMAIPGMDVAMLSYARHRYDESIEIYGKVHEVDPDAIPVPFVLAQAYERNGQYQKAIEECHKALASFPDNPAVLSALGYALARSGKADEAQGILNKFQETRKTHYVSPFLIAVLCAGMGKKDAAFDWLNKACDERDPQVIWINLEPQLEPLRSDPRFTSLLQRLAIS